MMKLAACYALLALCLHARQVIPGVIDNNRLLDDLVKRVIEKRGTTSTNPASPLDLRVTPALGSKKYGSARISVISSAGSPLEAGADFFTYNRPFQYRWKDKYLHSKLETIITGKTQNTKKFDIGGANFTIRYPLENEGVRGIIIADPCFHGAYMGCTFGGKFQTFERSTALLNAGANDIDYYMILGDNFYDRYGNLSSTWYDQLTLELKSKLFATVAGNHDYWSVGTPLLASKDDQFGNGHMQFYGMDSISSKNNDVEFLNFTVDPDKETSGHRMAAMENFFSYFKIGNAAFLLYSGGYTYQDTKKYFQEGCAYFKEAKPDIAFILGHWNNAGLGCSKEMDVPAVYEEIKGMDGCKALDDKNALKYVMGHTHCNKVVEKDKGFMVAGQGMEGCGNFGIPFVDTREGRVEIIYYNVQDLTGADNYEKVLDCFQTKGISNCKDLGTVWLNHTLESQ